MDSGGGRTASAAAMPPPFLSKSYDMVDDPSTDAVVSWGKNNNSFVVWNVPEFSRDLLPKYFKHSNFSSFVRQLNTYGFRKVEPDRWEFANETFLRGHRHLLKSIIRRKPSHAPPPQPQHQQPPPQGPSPSTPPYVELEKFGIEEEVEGLKRDKKFLVHELVRLRHQQQSTDSELQTAGQRVHSMEQRQQQMMTFLAKAMQSPGLIAQMVHSDGNRQITSRDKKRRPPNQEEDNLNLPHKYSIASLDGRIVKYQPLMNEAAMSMLRQILKINTSGRRETKLSNPNGFLLDSSSSSSNKMPAVTLAEIQSNTGLPDFIPPQEVSFENNVELQYEPFMETEPTSRLDGVLGDCEVDIVIDDSQKLPGINDVFWEQFLSDSPFTGETDDVSTDKDQEEQEFESDRLRNLSNLTEQMGLLASSPRG